MRRKQSEGGATRPASAAAQRAMIEAGQVTIMLRTASGSRFSAVVKPSDTIRDLKNCRSTRIATDGFPETIHVFLQFHLPNVHQLYLSWRETHYAGCSITDLLYDRQWLLLTPWDVRCHFLLLFFFSCVWHLVTMGGCLGWSLGHVALRGHDLRSPESSRNPKGPVSGLSMSTMRHSFFFRLVP